MDLRETMRHYINVYGRTMVMAMVMSYALVLVAPWAVPMVPTIHGWSNWLS